jgi:hypothetical protein
MVQVMTVRLDSIKTIAAAEKALYGVLTDAQRATADELLFGPTTGMGPMIGMGSMSAMGPMTGAGGQAK